MSETSSRPSTDVPTPQRPSSGVVGAWRRVPSNVKDIVGLLGRLLVGIVWIVAGYLKAIDATQTIVSVRAYQLLSESMVYPVAAVLPYLEIAAGLLLVLGLATRLASILSALLFIAFLIGIISAAARGLNIDCGCFGTGGEVDPNDTAYTSEILRDFGLLAVSIYLACRPKSFLSLDWLAHRGTDRSEADTA